MDDSDLFIEGADGLEQYRLVILPVKVMAGERIILNPSVFKRQ